MRVSKKLIENQFIYWLKLNGYKKAESYNDVGAWRIDYVSCYGGYNIELIINDGGAVSHPFGGKRLKPSDFSIFLEQIIQLESYRKWNGDLIKKVQY